MLTKNSLQLFTRHQERVGDVFTLRCLRHIETTISDTLDFKYREEMIKEVKRKMLVDIWYDLYGDVIKSIPPLQHECLMRMDRVTVTTQNNPVEAGFSDLMKLLKPPVQWMDEMEPIRLKVPQYQE